MYILVVLTHSIKRLLRKMYREYIVDAIVLRYYDKFDVAGEYAVRVDCCTQIGVYKSQQGQEQKLQQR